MEQEKKEFSLPVVKSSSGELSIKDFETFKESVAKQLATYYVFEIQTPSDYKTIKETRAELNALAKLVNDTKISCVADLTKTFSSECKELVDMIKAKSDEFNLVARTYETNTLNKDTMPKKAKYQFSVIINVKDKEELEKLKKRLGKVYDYTIKEN